MDTNGTVGKACALISAGVLLIVVVVWLFGWG